MKDAQHWQNRVELSLDNRQIFLLFFASAVVVSLVFALGVVVGKRLDKQLARTAATTDPLAVLDQMGQDNGEDTLTFHEALSKGKAESTQAPSDAGAAPTPAVQAPAKAGEPKQRPPAEPARPAVKPEPLPPPPVKALAEKKSPAPPSAATVKSGAEGGKKETDKPQKVAASTEEGSYTLQLSSFQEKREAELFMQKLREAGMQPYMTPTTIPGRGVWFRVRLGHFKTWDEALNAKQNFEKKQKIIAYVSKL
jgi:septal ring-binding cell division protein DamX